MIEAPPVLIRAAHDALQSVARELTGYAVEGNGAVWLVRGDRPPLLITSVSHDIVFKFEVFTLAVRTASETVADARAFRPNLEEIVGLINASGGDLSLPPPMAAEITPGPCVAWPFQRWEVAVLWERQWIMSMEGITADWNDDTQGLPFGGVPTKTEHASFVARGLLFTGEDGRRLVINQGEMPLDLLITEDAEVIEKLLVGALAMPLGPYLAGVLPSA